MGSLIIYRVCIATSLMWLLKHLSNLVVLHRGCLDKSGKWPHEMISLCAYTIRVRPRSIFNTDIRRWRTNKVTPRNSFALCATWGRMNTHRLMHMLHGSSGFGYWLLSNSRSGWVIAWTPYGQFATDCLQLSFWLGYCMDSIETVCYTYTYTYKPPNTPHPYINKPNKRKQNKNNNTNNNKQKLTNKAKE